MGTSKNAVEVRDVKKSFYLPHHKNDSLKTAITQVFQHKEKGGNTFNALNGISFNVEKGDFFGILGRNGSGKSTLLKIISEIYQPTNGSVKHNGKVVSFIELGVGFKPELTGRENVFLNGALLGFSKKEVEAMYDDIVEFAEIKDFMEQKLKNYSSGMKVRLAFSVAIRARADILILDEVLAVGDASFQKKCNDYFRTLKDDKKTVILVTHNMNAVRDYCNKAIVIENGKILYEGEAEEAADEYLKLFVSKKLQGIDSAEGTVTASNILATVTKETVKIEIELYSHVDATVYIATDIYRNDELVGGISCDKQKDKHLSLRANTRSQVSINLDNHFGNGEYTVTVGVRDPTTNELYTRISNAASFKVKGADSAHLAYIIPASISVANLRNN